MSAALLIYFILIEAVLVYNKAFLPLQIYISTVLTTKVLYLFPYTPSAPFLQTLVLWSESRVCWLVSALLCLFVPHI